MLGLMDIKVQRNAFGRQVDSFETDLEIDELMKVTGTDLPGVKPAYGVLRVLVK